MAKYRASLPLTDDEYFLTDSGLETTLIFHEGVDLPQFAAFVLLQNEEGRKMLKGYFQKYVFITKEFVMR